MPEPASSRSLEDILASIRKSLADETVDGLVELSAAAVDAVRAEERAAPGTPVAADAALLAAKGTSPALSAADALADDLLRDKLAGALIADDDADATEERIEDLSTLLAESGAERPGLARDAASPDPGGETGVLSNIWVLRPGRDDSQPVDAASRPPALTLDPFAEGRTTGRKVDKSVFDLSPLELIRNDEKPAPGVAQDPPFAARQSSADVELLTKLRASNAAAIEKIARSNAEAEADAEPEARDPHAVSEAATTDEAPVESGESNGRAPVAAAPVEADADVTRPVVSLPLRSTPLFGAQPESRPVTSGLDHLLAATDTASLQPMAEPALVQEAVAPADAATESSSAVHDAEPEPVLSTSTDAATPPEVEPGHATAPTEPELVHQRDEASEATPDLLEAAAVGNPKALEDMIAAVLEPVLQRLIETSVTPILETLVRQEVERRLMAQQEPAADRQ